MSRGGRGAAAIFSSPFFASALLLMLASVAALSTSGRLTQRFRRSNYIASSALQSVFKSEKNVFIGAFRCFATQSSQVDYDNRKLHNNGNNGNNDGNGMRTFKTDNLVNVENVRRMISEEEKTPLFPHIGESKGSKSDRELLENAPLKVDGRQLVVTMVCNKARAREVLAIMAEQQRKNPKTIWACDTEVMDIDLKLVGEWRIHCILYELLWHIRLWCRCRNIVVTLWG